MLSAEEIIKDIEQLNNKERIKLLEYLKNKFFNIHFEPIKAGNEWLDEEENNE